jgi:hypothetical protein
MRKRFGAQRHFLQTKGSEADLRAEPPAAKAEESRTKPKCLSGLERSDIKKDLLPGRQKAESPQWIQLSSRLKSRRSCRLNELLILCRSV